MNDGPSNITIRSKVLCYSLPSWALLDAGLAAEVSSARRGGRNPRRSDDRLCASTRGGSGDASPYISSFFSFSCTPGEYSFNEDARGECWTGVLVRISTFAGALGVAALSSSFRGRDESVL